jgi:hypothetical protein
MKFDSNMKKLLYITIFMLIQTNNAQFSNEEVKKELQEMVAADQELRKKALYDAHQTARSLNEVMQEFKLDELNAKHCSNLKKIIQQYGWPTLSEFDQEACQDTWLLVQHSTNLDFQKECLALMTQLPDHEIEQRWIAYLYDRIQINENKPQRYGTQIDSNTELPYPLEDREHIEELRKKMGLEHLDEYLAFCKECKKRHENL